MFATRGCLGLVLGFLLLAAPLRGAEGVPALNSWPQWRGPTRDGQVSAATRWPAKLGVENFKQLYRVPLGPSYSGPIVTSDRVFVTETRDKKTEVVSALDRQTGKVLWSVKWPGSLIPPFFAAANGGWIRATPASDGENLYVGGILDVLVCLRGSDGQELWRVNFVEQFKSAVPAFGFVSSPLIQGEHLFVQAGGSLAKLDKKTGKVLWRTLEDKGGLESSAFSSPVLATVAGREQILVQTRQKLAGVDPESGKVLWSTEVPAFRGMNILTPTVIGDTIFTSSYGGKSFLYKITGNTEALQLSPVWENKTQAYMSSPVVIGNYVYLHLRNQRFTCIDLTTGAEKWTTKPYGQYWSLVAQGNRLLALDEKGDLLLLAANPEKFELISTLKISEDPTWAHLAISGEQVFIRELKALAVYQWSP